MKKEDSVDLLEEFGAAKMQRWDGF